MRISDVIIDIGNLEVRMFLGIHSHEKVKQQRVLISTKIELMQDKIDDPAFYDYDRVKEFISGFAGRKIDTQENLIREILGFIMNDASVKRAWVMSKKPDIFPEADYVGVSMSAERE